MSLWDGVIYPAADEWFVCRLCRAAMDIFVHDADDWDCFLLVLYQMLDTIRVQADGDAPPSPYEE